MIPLGVPSPWDTTVEGINLFAEANPAKPSTTDKGNHWSNIEFLF